MHNIRIKSSYGFKFTYKPCLLTTKFHIFDHEMEHSDLEEDAITSYYAIYNNRERGNGVQFKEGLRNNIVKKMDDSKTFGSFVAAVTSVIPMN
eukprot:Pgem_evm1s11911